MTIESNLEFNYLQIVSFIYVAKTKSYSAAAKVLGKGRSTISEHIDAFEAELGQPLFEKNGRSLDLTPIGKEILSHSVLLNKQVRTWTKVVENSIKKGNHDRYRVAYTDAFPKSVLLQTLKKINAQGDQLELIEVSQSIAHNMLENDQIDLLISPTVTNDKSRNDLSEWKIIGSMPFRFYAHENFFPNNPVNISQIVSSTQILPRVYTDKYEDNFLIFTTNNVSINDITLLKEALMNKMGWAFLPVHLKASTWKNIIEVNTEMGSHGYITPIAARWRTGELNQISNVLNAIEESIRSDEHKWLIEPTTGAIQ